LRQSPRVTRSRTYGPSFRCLAILSRRADPRIPGPYKKGDPAWKARRMPRTSCQREPSRVRRTGRLDTQARPPGCFRSDGAKGRRWLEHGSSEQGSGRARRATGPPRLRARAGSRAGLCHGHPRTSRDARGRRVGDGNGAPCIYRSHATLAARQEARRRFWERVAAAPMRPSPRH
jgi:hypothetical protein